MNKITTITLVSMLVVMLLVNQWQLSTLTHAAAMSDVAKTDQSNANSTVANPVSSDIAALTAQLIARGVPPVYGAELGVSFDDAAAAIPTLSRFEQDTRTDKLAGSKLERYVKIGQSISCEFCCGATTMVFPDGRKACACAHSAAMRGVAAYLLDTRGDTMTDQEILNEVAQWKSVFFPGPTIQKYLAQTGQAGGSNQALPSQVGGC